MLQLAVRVRAFDVLASIASADLRRYHKQLADLKLLAQGFRTLLIFEDAAPFLARLADPALTRGAVAPGHVDFVTAFTTRHEAAARHLLGACDGEEAVAVWHRATGKLFNPCHNSVSAKLLNRHEYLL